MKKGDNMETWGEEENDCATKQSSLLMRRSDHLSTFKLCNEINVTSTSTFEFDCSHYFCFLKNSLITGIEAMNCRVLFMKHMFVSLP